MKISDWLAKTGRSLHDAGIGTARLDALILLEDMLGKDRSYLLAHSEREISASQLRRLNQQIARRAKHEPLAYIRGFVEFYGRRFSVDKNVLIPRPETETMIDMVKKLDINDGVIADVGSGSGCIGITIKLEHPSANVDLIDIDPKTISIARQNAKQLQADVTVYKDNLLAKPRRVYDVVAANLPYVPSNFTVNEAALTEPKHAIYGGTDGLDYYRQLFAQIGADSKLRNMRHVVTESLPPQHQQLVKIAKHAGFTLTQTDDFIQLFSRA